jgi:predicted MFS family arabinose efflux permease
LNRSLKIQIPTFVAARTTLNTMVRMVYPFLAAFSRGLGVELWMISLALTIRSATGALGPFLASIADSRGRKPGMLVGMLLFVSGAALMSIWPTYPAFVIALVLTILGNYLFIPSMQAYLGDRVPYQRRALVLALTEYGWSLSSIIGVPLIGFLIARWGWAAPFPFLALMGLLAMGALAWLVPADTRIDARKLGFWTNLRDVLTHAPALAGLAMGFFVVAGNEVVNLVFGVWMEDTFAVKIAALGAASAVIGFSELSGESLVGLLTDRLGKSRAITAGLLFNGLSALLLPVLGSSVPGALLGLFLFYLTFEFALVSTIPLMTEVLPSTRATLMAVYGSSVSLGRAAGDLLAPALYSHGILLNGLVALTFNFLAILALHYVRLPEVKVPENLRPGLIKRPESPTIAEDEPQGR